MDEYVDPSVRQAYINCGGNNAKPLRGRKMKARLKKEKKQNLVFKFIKENVKAEFLAGLLVGVQFTGKKITIKDKNSKMLNEKTLTTFSLVKAKGTSKTIDEFIETFDGRHSASRFAQSARIAAGMFDVFLDAELKTIHTADRSIVYELTLLPSSPKEETKGDLLENILKIEDANDDVDEDDEDEDIPEDDDCDCGDDEECFGCCPPPKKPKYATKKTRPATRRRN